MIATFSSHEIEKKIGRFLAISLTLHFLIMVLFLIFDEISFLKNKNDFIIIPHQSSVKVDVVAMPRLTIKELQNIKVNTSNYDKVIEESEKQVHINETSDVEFHKKIKKKSFLNLLKGLSQKKIKNKVRKKQNRSKEKFKNYEGELKKLVLAGNKISRGFSSHWF